MNWLRKLFTRKDNRRRVVVHAYPPIIFVWPLILLGFLFVPLAHWGADPEVLAWIYICFLVAVVTTLGIDMNRNIIIFWLVVIALIWISIRYLVDAKHVTFFHDIAVWIVSLNPTWSPDFGLASSSLLLVLYVINLIKARLNDRWIFENNSIEHWSFGKNDDSIGRGAKVVSTTYPDILEMILLIAGTITVYNAQRNRTLVVIKGVPFLPFRTKKINQILEEVRVEDNADEEQEGGHEDNEDAGTIGG